ncbi:MAG: hypothetical protein WD468_09690 [Pirellulales bacterium]
MDSGAPPAVSSIHPFDLPHGARPPPARSIIASRTTLANPTSQLLTLNPGLSSATRLRWLTSGHASASVRDWLILAFAGVTAACASTFFDFSLRIPGHAILRVVFPMAVGLALVPRYGAGCVMGASAALTAGALRLGGFSGEGLSLGALTSLTATGPLLDWTLRRTSGGWRLYVAFAIAGLTSNLLAFAVRGIAKAVGWEHVGGRGLANWLPQASVTYTICGLLAGVIAAGVLFYSQRRDPPLPPESIA